MFGKSLSCQKQSMKLKLCNKNRSNNTHAIITRNLASCHHYNKGYCHAAYVKKRLPKGIKQSVMIRAINGSIFLVTDLTKNIQISPVVRNQLVLPALLRKRTFLQFYLQIVPLFLTKNQKFN